MYLVPTRNQGLRSIKISAFRLAADLMWVPALILVPPKPDTRIKVDTSSQFGGSLEVGTGFKVGTSNSNVLGTNLRSGIEV